MSLDFKFNQEKYNKASFNRKSGQYITAISFSKWNDWSYSDIQDFFVFNNVNYIEPSINIKWNNQILTSEITDNFNWINCEYVSEIFGGLWNEIYYSTSASSFKWGNRFYRRDLRFNQRKYNKSSFNRGTFYLTSESRSLWSNREFLNVYGNYLWKNLEFTSGFTSKYIWNNRIFAPLAESIVEWNNRGITSEITDLFEWNNACFNTSSSGLKWNTRMFSIPSSIICWKNVTYNISESIFVWLNGFGTIQPLTDYLSVKTTQNEYIFPNIIDGSISFKDGSIGEATLQLSEPIPEDSRCIFYLRGSVRMFDGISRRCTRDPNGIFKVTIQEYPEILKPENGKGGLYLVKDDWHDVQLRYLLSSNKPTDNNNEVGLLYMAASAISQNYFKEYDTVNNVFKFEYSGIPYSITEVFEDHVLLAPKTSAAALSTASGWYHDVVNTTLYIRCTDNAYPYYHTISVPYIWDSSVPVRIGNIKDLSTTVIAYWETANGDIPLTTFETLLTALNLEYEPVFRNGVCYLDVSSKIGSGSTSQPANYYREGDNVISIQEVDMSDARNMVNGVSLTGYGSGAGGVKSGIHKNMGRGGRFIILDDSSIHSQAVADGFVDKYLDDHYLPARSIKLTAPVFVGDAVDQRRLGDTAHVSLSLRKKTSALMEYDLEQDLRVKEVTIKLKPLTQVLTFGDKLISYDDQIKAMKDAAEKYRKHLQDEIEEFTWSWNENIISGANLSNKFTITADALKIQKMELSFSTSLFRIDAMQGASGNGGGGAGDGSSSEGESGDKPRTGPGEEHTHTLISGSVGTPSSTVQISAKGHTHTYASTSGSPSATTTVVTGVTSSTVTPNYGCCTAIGCGKQWLASVTVGAASVTTTTAASSSHTHSISGTTSGDDSWVFVADYVHTHTITSLSLSSESSHTHEISSDGYNPTLATKEKSEIQVDPSTGEVYPDWKYIDGRLVTSAEYYKAFLAPGSDPEMYLTIKLSGPGITGSTEITGSPYVIKVNDTVGPVLIDNLVKQAGEFTVTVGLSNKDTPTDQAKLNFSIQVDGKIFVDTIVKS